MHFHHLSEAKDLKGKRVILRLNLDMPMINGVLQDTYRLKRSMKTLEFLKDNGAKTLIISHIGRDPKETLFPIFEYLKKDIDIVFAKNLEEASRAVKDASEGKFVLLENLRQFPGETSNDPSFCDSVASIGDVYVNEAFSVSHREHASIVGIPRLLPSFAGFLFAEEVENLSKGLNPDSPSLLILGGAKFETKGPLIEKFLGVTDTVYVGGALANDIYRAKGFETGASLVSETIPAPELVNNPKLRVPPDVIAKWNLGRRATSADAVGPEEKIVDAGPDSLDELRDLISKASFILWNGPLGEYEAGFEEGTLALAEAIAESSAESIVGGGDSIAAISKLNLLERFSFVSTGGGAMLEFLANETLPGIDALMHG